jgi:hypothetical protein
MKRPLLLYRAGHRPPTLAVLALLVSLVIGCTQEQNKGAGDDSLSAAPQDGLALPPLDKEAQSRALDAVPTNPPAPVDKLKPDPPKLVQVPPRFQRGEQFPVIRTVTQSLTQTSSQGTTIGTSRLEAEMILATEETRDDGRTRLGVQFERLRYARDLAGDKFEFDSQAAPAQVPSDVLPYRGLAGNRFALWVGHDNRVQELVGFADFLDRSLSGMSPTGRAAIATRFDALPPEEIVSEFLDESIGLLRDDSLLHGPSTSLVKAGASWTRSRNFAAPVPHHVNTRYSIVTCTPESAEVDVLGTVTPPREAAAQPQTVVIHRGHIFGRCRIDRRTGLPIDSQIEQRLEMHIPSADGHNIEQQKRVVTTFRVGLPGAEAPRAASAN